MPQFSLRSLLSLALLLCPLVEASKASCSQKRKVVRTFNVHRNASSATTPLQVGNGNFAFGVDVTGLQTFKPFAIQSTWGWHNFSLPTAPNQTEISDFTGLDWWTHGRLVNYNQPNKAEPLISNWLIQNPQRLNLANIGFYFGGATVTESQLGQTSQVLDLWTGSITSTFVYKNSTVTVETWSSPDDPIAGIKVKSDLVTSGALGVFFDFPYSDVNKFDAPFVGVWNATANHSTTVDSAGNSALFQHTLDSNTNFLQATWTGSGKVSGPLAGTHRYVLTPAGSDTLELIAAFSPTKDSMPKSPGLTALTSASKAWWASYWAKGAFIDLSATNNANATELQRRILLSQYIEAVNSASYNPPQESGLVNNGWYGKFHLEMNLWHLLHFARWSRVSLLERSTPNMYQRFLPSSIDRAKAQGYNGARWGKMTDPTGRSAPGEINSLLIWQQPHPMHFAEYEYRAAPTADTLSKWDEVLTATADFMASYAFYNASTGVYDLGPPMYPVSENTNPNATINPTFELAYWRFGLDVALKWKQRQGLTAPADWTIVRDKLAPLPVVNGTFPVYEGIPNMWTDPATTNDHPAMSGIYGLLPPPSSGTPLDIDIVRKTAELIKETWALDKSYGWDFSMLAMNSLRLGDVEQCLAYLLHPDYVFDDAGYPEGGVRVATPYLPDAGGLLLATAMMASGWDGDEGVHFPKDWNVTVDGFMPAM